MIPGSRQFILDLNCCAWPLKKWDGALKAVEWAWPKEAGETMFHVVNTYNSVAAREGLSAESSYRLQLSYLLRIVLLAGLFDLMCGYFHLIIILAF
jgi:hypothetical protein